MFLWENTEAKIKWAELEILRFIRLMKVESNGLFKSCVLKVLEKIFCRNHWDSSLLNFTTRVHGECEFSMIQGWMTSCLLSICKAVTSFINNILIIQTGY